MIGAAHIGIIAGATPRASGGGGPGAGSALPVLSGLLAWFDASDSSTITESGGAVSQWDDRSGNGNHATQATGAEQPTLITAPSSLDALDFGDFGSSGKSMSYPAVSGKTFVAVVENTGGGGFLFGHSSNYPFHPYAGSIPASPILDSSFSSAALRTGSASCRRSGFVVSPTLTDKQTSWHVIVFRTDGTAIEVNRIFDDRGFPGTKGGGKLAELAVYDSVLSDADVIDIEAHLAQKWGVAHTLPFDHEGYVGDPAPSLPITTAPEHWLDASNADYRYVIGSALHELRDLAGSGSVSSRLDADKTRIPTLLSAEQNSLDVADFGVRDTYSTLRYSDRVAGNTFAIVVYADDSGYPGSFLFSDQAYYDFHRGGVGSNRSDAILSGLYGSANLRTGGAVTRKDGSVVDPTTTGLSVGWQIVVLRTNGSQVRANNLFNDRGGNRAGAKIGEQIIFDGVLSDGDVEKIEGYLAHKWGIAGSLPGGHPYKDSPPS